MSIDYSHDSVRPRLRLSDLLPGGRLFAWPLIVIANVPTIAVLLVHGGDQLLSFMRSHPGQFVFLGAFFPFAAAFVAAAGNDLEGLWTLRPPNPREHISTFYPRWAYPGLKRLGLALFIGVLIAAADGQKPAPYSIGSHALLLQALDFLELMAVVCCVFFLFLWSAVLARIRLDPAFRKYDPDKFSPRIRSAALHMIAALILFALYSPLRALSIKEGGGSESFLYGPQITFVLLLVALMVVTICFVPSGLLPKFLILPLVSPVVVTIWDWWFKSGEFTKRLVNDGQSLFMVIVIGLAVFFVLYSVLRGVFLGSDKGS